MTTADHRETEIQCLQTLPNHRVVKGTPTDGYVASVAEPNGCLTDGDTPTEALASLEEATAAWFESHLIHGDPIPGSASSLRPVA